MIFNTIKNTLEIIWPMLLIFSTIIIWARIFYLKNTNAKIVVHKELISLVFIIYIMCLFYIVTFQDVSLGESNFVPLKEMFRHEIGSRLFIKNVIGNILIFLPFGFFVSYYFKLKKSLPVLSMALITSLTIEITQSKIGRVFDIDDIILNVLGAMFGYFSYRFLDNIKNSLPKILKNDLIYTIIITIMFAILILYLFNFWGVIQNG